MARCKSERSKRMEATGLDRLTAADPEDEPRKELRTSSVRRGLKNMTKRPQSGFTTERLFRVYARPLTWNVARKTRLARYNSAQSDC
jgi:hypothetical protein